jgi:hypothetical protein
MVLKEVLMKRLAYALALGGITALVVAQTNNSQTLAGYISDSKCGAMHMDNAVACVKKCIENGNQPVFVDGEKRVWAVENPYVLKGYYGDNVKLEAVVNASAKSIRIDKVTRTGGVMGGMKDGVKP